MQSWLRRETIINVLILFYGIVGGAAAFIGVCALIFGWVPVPETAQTEFWRLVIVTMLTLGPIINSELRHRHTERIERRVAQTEEKVAQTLEVVTNGGGAGVKQIQASVDQLLQQTQRDPEQRTRVDDQPPADPDHPSEVS